MSSQLVGQRAPGAPKKPKAFRNALPPEPLISTAIEARLRTPRRSTEVFSAVNISGVSLTRNATSRLLFRKLGKSLDVRNNQPAKAQHQIEALPANVAQLKPIKQAKVQEDPNDRFVRIHDVIKRKETIKKTCQPLESHGDLDMVSFLNECSYNGYIWL